MNTFGSMGHLALAFGVNDIEEIPNELREILRLPYISLQNKMDLIYINSNFHQNVLLISLNM